jgi:anti-anti-sigma factor
MDEVSGQPGSGEAVAFAATLRSDEGGSATVVLAGELDIASVARLEQVLEQAVAAGRGPIRVEMSELTFCGATGVSALAQAHRTLTATGRALHLEHVPANIKQSLLAAEAGWLL